MVTVDKLKGFLRDAAMCLGLCILSHAIIHGALSLIHPAQASESHANVPATAPPNFCVSVEVHVGRKLLLKHWNGHTEWLDIPTEVCYACQNGKHFCEDKPGLVAQGPQLKDTEHDSQH